MSLLCHAAPCWARWGCHRPPPQRRLPTSSRAHGGARACCARRCCALIHAPRRPCPPPQSFPERHRGGWGRTGARPRGRRPRPCPCPAGGAPPQPPPARVSTAEGGSVQPPLGTVCVGVPSSSSRPRVWRAPALGHALHAARPAHALVTLLDAARCPLDAFLFHRWPRPSCATGPAGQAYRGGGPAPPGSQAPLVSSLLPTHPLAHIRQAGKPEPATPKHTAECMPLLPPFAAAPPLPHQFSAAAHVSIPVFDGQPQRRRCPINSALQRMCLFPCSTDSRSAAAAPSIQRCSACVYSRVRRTAAAPRCTSAGGSCKVAGHGMATLQAEGEAWKKRHAEGWWYRQNRPSWG